MFLWAILVAFLLPSIYFINSMRTEKRLHRKKLEDIRKRIEEKESEAQKQGSDS